MELEIYFEMCEDEEDFWFGFEQEFFFTDPELMSL